MAIVPQMAAESQMSLRVPLSLVYTSLFLPHCISIPSKTIKLYVDKAMLDDKGDDADICCSSPQ
jgi:hypothetical protein